ncbi:MAG: hypothetical protein LBN24_12185 [Mediterranea sp.]|jgi:hypothetical protein|nr:hypothetical protein [Mediterranea sp.]
MKMKRKKEVFHLLFLCAMALTSLCACDDNGSDNTLPTPDPDGMVTITLPVGSEWPENVQSRGNAQPVYSTCDLGKGYQLEATLTEDGTAPNTREMISLQDGKFVDGTLILAILFDNADNTNRPIAYQILQVDGGRVQLKIKDTGAYKILFISPQYTQDKGEVGVTDDMINSTYTSDFHAWVGSEATSFEQGTYYELKNTTSLPDECSRPGAPDIVYASLMDVSASNNVGGAPIRFRHIEGRIKITVMANSAKKESIYSMDIRFGPARYGQSWICMNNIATYCFGQSSSLTVRNLFGNEKPITSDFEEIITEYSNGKYVFTYSPKNTPVHLHIFDLIIKNSDTGKKTEFKNRTWPIVDAQGNPVCFEPGNSYSLTVKVTAASGS